jgi:hypothetical protein
MASVLKELGANAFLLRDRRSFNSRTAGEESLFSTVSVPSADFAFEDAGPHLQRDDVILLHEGIAHIPPVWRSWNCRLALINQNGFFSLKNCDRPKAGGKQFEFAITVAPYISAICRSILGIAPNRIFEVPHWVVRPPFQLEQLSAERSPAICVMPRKLPEIVEQVRKSIERDNPDVPWFEIDDMPEAEVARQLRAHSIFFAAHDLEACPTSGLEAMACGCLVAGFGGTGRFPHPYATLKNGIWASDRNVGDAIRAVQTAIDVVRKAGASYGAYLDAGRRTVQRFTKESMVDALSELLLTVQGGRYRDRRGPVRKLGWRGHAYAYRLLYDYERLGWPGRVLGSIGQATKPLRRRWRSMSRVNLA